MTIADALKQHPLPYRKKMLQFEETQGGRTITRWAILDAKGFELFKQFMFTEDSEDVVDMILERVNATAVSEVAAREVEGPDPQEEDVSVTRG